MSDFPNPSFHADKISETNISKWQEFHITPLSINDSAVVRLAPFSYSAWRHGVLRWRGQANLLFHFPATNHKDEENSWRAIHWAAFGSQWSPDTNGLKTQLSDGFHFFFAKYLQDAGKFPSDSHVTQWSEQTTIKKRIKSEITITDDKTRKSSKILPHLFIFFWIIFKMPEDNGNVLHGWM